MNIHHVVFFCFLSAALCGGNTGLVRAKLDILTGPEGGTGTVSCPLTVTGNTKFFCRDECKGEDVLIKTDAVRAQNGRYSIYYSNGSSGSGTLTVTIKPLAQSDAGRYRCGLGNTSAPDSYLEFGIRVSDEALMEGNSGFINTFTEGDNFTFPCSKNFYGGPKKFFCKNKCEKVEDILVETEGNRTQNGRYSIEYVEDSPYGLRVTITQVTKLDTGRYTCGFGRALPSGSNVFFLIIVIDAPTTAKPNWTTQPFSTSVMSASVYVLPVVVCVLVVVGLLAGVLLLFYRMKTNRNSDGRNMECINYENDRPVSRSGAIYQNLNPASRDQEETRHTV